MTAVLTRINLCELLCTENFQLSIRSDQGNSFFCRLKTIEIVIRNTQGAEDVVKKYENRLREVHTVPTNVQEVENYCSELKVIFTVHVLVDALFYVTLGESCSIL